MWLNRGLAYSMLGSKNMYAKYQAFVLKGIDPVTEAFYGGDSITGVYGEKEFRQAVFDEREFHEIANGLPQLVAQRPEMEEIVSVVRGCLVSHGKRYWRRARKAADQYPQANGYLLLPKGVWLCPARSG